MRDNTKILQTHHRGWVNSAILHLEFYCVFPFLQTQSKSSPQEQEGMSSLKPFTSLSGLRTALKLSCVLAAVSLLCFILKTARRHINRKKQPKLVFPRFLTNVIFPKL